MGARATAQGVFLDIAGAMLWIEVTDKSEHRTQARGLNAVNDMMKAALGEGCFAMCVAGTPRGSERARQMRAMSLPKGTV